MTVKAEVHPSRFETSESLTHAPQTARIHQLMHPARLLHTQGVGVMCNAPKNLRVYTQMSAYIYGGATSRCEILQSQNHPNTANMAPHSNRTDSFTTADSHQKPKLTKATPPRNVEWIEQVEWDSSLQPKDYDIQGTHPDSKILFLNVNILDSTGREPYLGDVLIQGKKANL
jgi:hypothetical protein